MMISPERSAAGQIDGHTPTLSVVVVSFNKNEILARCLEALTAQADPEQVELLAVGRWSEKAAGMTLRDRFPTVTWVTALEKETIPQMRSRGILKSCGRIVALLEDDCLVSANWCDGVIAAHRVSDPAIGGPIEPDDYRSNRDWGIYFCEYGRFMAPFDGVVPALPGNNVSYKRDMLRDVSLENGFYEVFVHWTWQQEGLDLQARSDLSVRNVNRWSMQHVTRVPYHHGRAFAGMRWVNRPYWQRLLTAVITPLLPLLQIARIGRESVRRRRLIGRTTAALPFIWLFASSWAWGEFVGTLLGPGDSQERWR